MDLTQKLWERPTPKFYRRGASCDRASHRILIAGTEHGRLSLSRWEEALELPLAFQKKKWPLFGRATNLNKYLI
jgi:hypothetical protein